MKADVSAGGLTSYVLSRVASDADPELGLALESRRQRGVGALTGLEDEGLRPIVLINEGHDTHARGAGPAKYSSHTVRTGDCVANRIVTWLHVGQLVVSAGPCPPNGQH